VKAATEGESEPRELSDDGGCATWLGLLLLLVLLLHVILLLIVVLWCLLGLRVSLVDGQQLRLWRLVNELARSEHRWHWHH
jgi:hypothetical protein